MTKKLDEKIIDALAHNVLLAKSECKHAVNIALAPEVIELLLKEQARAELVVASIDDFDQTEQSSMEKLVFELGLYRKRCNLQVDKINQVTSSLAVKQLGFKVAMQHMDALDLFFEMYTDLLANH